MQEQWPRKGGQEQQAVPRGPCAIVGLALLVSNMRDLAEGSGGFPAWHYILPQFTLFCGFCGSAHSSWWKYKGFILWKGYIPEKLTVTQHLKTINLPLENWITLTVNTFGLHQKAILKSTTKLFLILKGRLIIQVSSDSVKYHTISVLFSHSNKRREKDNHDLLLCNRRLSVQLPPSLAHLSSGVYHSNRKTD